MHENSDSRETWACVCRITSKQQNYGRVDGITADSVNDHYSLILSKDIERIQKRCLKLLCPYFSYTEALNKSGLDRLDYTVVIWSQKTYLEKLKILSTHSITNKLTFDPPTRLPELTQNLIMSSHGHSTSSLKISCKSVQPFSRNVADKETKKERNRPKTIPRPLPGAG